ncbi:MAG: malto-oligosyltrehalose trehalohydrolase [Cyanobacteriota bacterium]|nr:malto-oligosyltrehalose trehalohydrolase [Cyanobacteriota bacterium]
MNHGCHYGGEGRCQFRVWAPLVEHVAVTITPKAEGDPLPEPLPILLPMTKDAAGYWQVMAEQVFPGWSYRFQLNHAERRPDPASQWQPQGVHADSVVVDQGAFAWRDQGWTGIPLEEWIVYELHVGTFTPAGTFAAAIPRIGELVSLGVNAIELMPVSPCPGRRNWGYDGVYPYAVQDAYGGPTGLKMFVDACHRQGIAVILDVVYSHLGPEGNYLSQFAPYFTSKYQTPWGQAINFDDRYCDPVRAFFLENALFWLENYHIDGLRLDAIHAIYDMGCLHFLEELAQQVKAFAQQKKRLIYLIAESDLNDVKVIAPTAQGGYGLDSQWCDDFHHALHHLITGESNGYYADYRGVEDLAKAYREGYVYSGQYSPYRSRKHGNSSLACPGHQLVVCIQNHDQVGNRMLGERLSRLTDWQGLKLAAAALLLSPFIPMIFMGEEYGETAPFLYFVDHGDPELIRAVQKGRQVEFKAFAWQGSPPDPQSEDTFNKSKLTWENRRQGRQKILWQFYQALLQWRRATPALAHLHKQAMKVGSDDAQKLIWIHRWHHSSQAYYVMNFDQEKTATLDVNVPNEKWQKVLDSAEAKWLGQGSQASQSLSLGESLVIAPFSMVLYVV